LKWVETEQRKDVTQQNDLLKGIKVMRISAITCIYYKTRYKGKWFLIYFQHSPPIAREDPISGGRSRVNENLTAKNAKFYIFFLGVLVAWWFVPLHSEE
jgi:hypothetical protein